MQQTKGDCVSTITPGSKLIIDKIVRYAHERLSSKVTYTNAVFALLPQFFTLTQLQLAYEAILGRKLDKRNFRKKFLSLELVEPSDKYHQEGAHRPALLYRLEVVFLYLNEPVSATIPQKREVAISCVIFHLSELIKSNSTSHVLEKFGSIKHASPNFVLVA